jgi:hypothetical protein
MHRFTILLLALEATGSLLDRRHGFFQRRQDADANAISVNGASSIPAASASDILASIQASIAATANADANGVSANGASSVPAASVSDLLASLQGVTATSLPEGATVVTSNGAVATVIITEHRRNSLTYAHSLSLPKILSLLQSPRRSRVRRPTMMVVSFHSSYFQVVSSGVSLCRLHRESTHICSIVRGWRSGRGDSSSTCASAYSCCWCSTGCPTSVNGRPGRT